MQQFTTDKRLLNTAIDHVKFKFTTRAASFSPANLARTLEAPNVGSRVPATDSNLPGAFEHLEGADVCMEETNSVIGSVGAIRYVVQRLRHLPGRKALILFSENLPIATRPDQANDSSGPGGCDYSGVIRSACFTMARR